MNKTEEQIEQYNNPDYNISTLWDKVKWEILDRWYGLVNKYSEFNYFVLRTQDNSERLRDMTTAVNTMWLLLKDYESVDKNNVEILNLKTLIKKCQEESSTLSIEGVNTAMDTLASIMNATGLTNIEYEKTDPSTAMRRSV